MTSDLPIISQRVFEEAFAFLEKLQVELDENPLEFGPRRLNNKVANTRQMLTHTEKLFNRVSQWLQKYKAAHRAAETNLDLAKKHLFANDPETRAGRNHTTQDAIASIKLGDDVREVARLSSIIEDLTALMAVINTKRADLKDVQARLRDQIKLCHEEIGLGNNWGSKAPPKDGKGAPADVVTLTELTRLLEGVRIKGEALVQKADAEVPQDRLDEIEANLSEEPPVGEGLAEEAEEVIPAPRAAPPEPTPPVVVEEPPLPEEPPAAVVEQEEPPLPEELPPPSENEEKEEEAKPRDLTSYPQIGYCEDCGSPQYLTPSGEVCANGHGGAGTVDHPSDARNAPQSEITPPVKPAALEGTGTDRDADQFLNNLGTPGASKTDVDVDDILSGFGIEI